MRLQLDLVPVGHAEDRRLSPAEAEALAGRLRDRLVDAGFAVELDQDRADVSSDNSDWSLLTPQEQATGGFDYPELTVEGPAALLVDVFLRTVFVSTEPDFDAEQAATAQVVQALRAIEPLVTIPADDWRYVEQTAARTAIAPDGSILRPVLSWSELSDRAIALFDEARSPEHERPTTATTASRLAALGGLCAALPPFRGSIAADPSGSAFAIELPYAPPFDQDRTKPLQDELTSILTDALREADERTGLPTGVVIEHDAGGTRGRLFYDNLVDGGVWTTREHSGHRSTPFAWEDITTAAARRDPAFQPTWLPEAVALLAAGGTEVTVSTVSSNSTSSTVSAVGVTTDSAADAPPTDPRPIDPSPTSEARVGPRDDDPVSHDPKPDAGSSPEAILHPNRQFGRIYLAAGLAVLAIVVVVSVSYFGSGRIVSAVVAVVVGLAVSGFLVVLGLSLLLPLLRAGEGGMSGRLAWGKTFAIGWDEVVIDVPSDASPGRLQIALLGETTEIRAESWDGFRPFVVFVASHAQAAARLTPPARQEFAYLLGLSDREEPGAEV